ncbi:MAG TPA: MarR family transcriptional regulator [Clostridia bacterium]|jgi:DNA-binding MarR family transcriptional regulator|nr:MarR family transcriptional regulator [Clostridia bacterium]
MMPPKTIGHEVKSLSNLIRRYLHESAKNTELEDLTAMQGWIIAYLYHRGNGQEIFQRDIEKKFDVRRSTVTGVLKLMEQKGLITREPVEHDARLKSLKLTPKAVSLHEMVMQKFEEVENKLRSGLTEEEIEAFFEIIDKIKGNITR